MTNMTMNSKHPSRVTDQMQTPCIGRKAAFDEQTLALAGLAVGLPNITIAAVAQHIGVGPSALYRLVENRNDLVILAVKAIAKRIPPIPDTGTWKEVLRSFAWSVWDTCEAYNGLSDTLWQVPGAYLAFNGYVSQLISLLTSRGFSIPEAHFAIDIIGDTVLATHFGLGCYRRSSKEDAESYGRIQNRLATDEHASQFQGINFVSLSADQQCAISKQWVTTRIDFLINALASQRPVYQPLPNTGAITDAASDS